jgi:hypothetical protein
MNRRTALLLPMFLGGLFPSLVRGQQSRAKRTASGSRDRSLEPASRVSDDPDSIPAGTDDSAPTFATEPGFQWKTFDISRYCRLDSKQTNPQKAIIDWIFKRTGINEWHGDKMAVLSASRNQLRAYNSPDVLKQVTEILERFTDSTDDVLSVHVQMIAANDTRWRYAVFSELTPVGSGPQGQQIWTMLARESALVLSSMQIQQGFRKLADQRIEMINGQALTITTKEPRNYAGGMQRDGAAGGFQPRPEKLDESIILKLSPLLNYDGNMVDAMIDLTVNTVRSFHRTKVIAPRETGNGEMAIDVPEATETHLDQTVKNWPLGQTLLISAGVHPGILDKKGGWFNLGIPGTYPTSTEVLVFLDIETVAREKPARESSAPAAKPKAQSRTRAKKAQPADDDEIIVDDAKDKGADRDPNP